VKSVPCFILGMFKFTRYVCNDPDCFYNGELVMLERYVCAHPVPQYVQKAYDRLSRLTLIRQVFARYSGLHAPLTLSTDST
jgi:hypothetical protein